MTLSVVIVSYNVKVFLEQCLNSVIKAAAGISTEIFVVDNNSLDGSQAMLRSRFSPFTSPELSIHLILNSDNLGFGKANNQALRQCHGNYVLILNPDTIVSEDTFQKMIAFMKTDAQIGAAGCKLLNADGSFQLACRRSFPSPEISFYKMIGLARLFPKSKRFARYNLTYLPTDETYEVDALMGAFMFLRREILAGVGLFDEAFFMYGEDLDWCYRIKAAGWKIFYYHETEIIHYKGESTKLQSFNYVVRFYEAMLVFVRKHYSGGRYSGPFELVLITGIYARASFAVLRRLFNSLAVPVLDLSLIMLSIVAGFKYKFTFYPGEFLTVVLPVYTTLWMLTLATFGQYRPLQLYSLKTLFPALTTAFLLSTTLTFFFKQYAFSRIGITASYVVALVLLTLWRVIARAFFIKAFSGALDREKRVAIVGTGAEAVQVAAKLRADISRNLEIVGFIARDEQTELQAGESALGTLADIAEAVSVNRLHELIFVSPEISNTEMLAAISRCNGRTVGFKIASSDSDVVIGKNSIDELGGTLNLASVDFNLSRPTRQASKRIFDLILLPVLLLLSPAIYMRGHRKVFRDFPQVAIGRKTLIGAASEVNGFSEGGAFVGKAGVWSLAGLRRYRMLPAAEREQIDLFYAKNSSLGLDTEILFKALSEVTQKV